MSGKATAFVILHHEFCSGLDENRLKAWAKLWDGPKLNNFVDGFEAFDHCTFNQRALGLNPKPTLLDIKRLHPKGLQNGTITRFK